MRLIDADRLLQRTKFYNLKNGNRAIDEIDILHAQTVKAIPLDKVKQAKLEVEDIRELTKDGWKSPRELKEEFIEILDKLIESEN